MTTSEAKQVFKGIAARLGYDVSTPAALRSLFCDVLYLDPSEITSDIVNEANWILAAILLDIHARAYPPNMDMETALDVPPAQTGPRGPAH